MRIRRLDLEFFGHFTGKCFDFGKAGEGPDFHVIHGPNEAGKTTTMEAYLRLLYGFAARGEPYDFRHQRKNLRVSGVLEIEGAERAFTRLPVRSGSLLDGHGNPLPENAISAWLGGLGQDDYRHLLCLDDDTIERGGEEIARARGDIGRLLFSAAAGISDLSGVLDEVQARADTLYRRRAHTTELAKMKKELAEVERRIREMDIPAAAYRKLKQACVAAGREEEVLKRERDDMRGLEARLRAARTAMPLLAELDLLRDRVAPFVDYPERLDVNPEDLVGLLTDQTRAASAAERLDAEKRGLGDELARIERHPERVALAEELDALEELRSRDALADRDLARRRSALSEVLGDMRRSARDLGVPEVEDPLRLVVPAAAITRLEAAREVLRRAESQHEAECREAARLEARAVEARVALEALESNAGTDAGVTILLERFAIDTLAPAHAAAMQALRSARAQFCEALDALSIKGQCFETLPDCALTEEEARDLCDRHATLGQDVMQCRQALEAHREDAIAGEARITRLASCSGLVNDADTEALMTEREALWAAHRAALDADTAEVFEAAMRQVDRAAEVRLAQARELGELRQAEQALADVRVRAEQAAARLDQAETARNRIEAEVAEAASASGLAAPVTPSALLVWVQRHGTARAACHHLERMAAEYAPVLDQAERLVEALQPHVSLEAPDFDPIVAAARGLAASERQHVDALAAARKELAGGLREAACRRADVERAATAAGEAREAWEVLVREVLDGLVAPGILLDSLEPLRTLRELETRRTATQRQIDTMESDKRQFGACLAELATRHGQDLAQTSAETFTALRSLAAEAEAAEVRHQELCAKIKETSEALAAARTTLEEIDRCVAAYGALFPDSVPTATIADLRSAVTDATATIEARTRIAALEARVLAELSLPDLDAARAALDGQTLSDLEAKAAGLESDLPEIEERLRCAIAARASAGRDLDAVTGDADVVLLVERKATLELEIEAAALCFLELDFGRRIAEEAIRRYRDAHRTGMMQATERAFAELTNGAYARLCSQTECEADVLMAIDAEGTAKRVQDLSKGTRFQLYLALRAAAYEQLAGQGIRLPFFCDDIFETFDEARTEAACRVMERIGRTGQAIYLTHHRHVVEIARTVCSEGPVIHEIG